MLHSDVYYYLPTNKKTNNWLRIKTFKSAGFQVFTIHIVIITSATVPGLRKQFQNKLQSSSMYRQQNDFKKLGI